MADELEESGGLREVPASKILAKIEKAKPVEFRFDFSGRVLWPAIKDRLDYDDSAYLALIKNHDKGKFEDADNCMFQYRTLRRKGHVDGLQLALNYISWFFYSYGVRFCFPLVWLVELFFISAVIYMLSGQSQFPGAFGLSAVILTTTTQIGSLTGPC